MGINTGSEVSSRGTVALGSRPLAVGGRAAAFTPARRGGRTIPTLLGVLALLLASVVLSAMLGAATIPPQATVAVLLESVGVATPWSAEVDETHRQIVRAIRLPRIVVALLVGAALATAGTAMQAVFANPMADPGLIGVSAGGGLGAVAAIASGLAAWHYAALPGAAFLGALLASMAVFVFSLHHGRAQVATLLLGGVAVTYLCSAATSLIITSTYDRDALREMLFWLLGGLDNRGWPHVQLIAVPVLLGVAVTVLHARALNLLLLGEEEAQSLGLNVGRARAAILGTAALMTGVAVAVSGLIGFVGLVVPHVVRQAVGPDHRRLVPLAALGGAWFLLAADTLARTILQPTELRVGIVTAFVGAPFFLVVLSRTRSRLRSL